MIFRPFYALLILSTFSLLTTSAAPTAGAAAGEYARHFGALSKLSVAVAEAMPADKYGFRPHPESMTFGELMSHIATTNYQFCAGLKDTAAPAIPAHANKDDVVKFLSGSFDYCSAAVASATEEQLAKVH